MKKPLTVAHQLFLKRLIKIQFEANTGLDHTGYFQQLLDLEEYDNTDAYIMNQKIKRFKKTLKSNKNG